MAHQYTNRGLRLALLKGIDFCRAHHVAQSCVKHGDFYALLANMVMHRNDPNCEEEQREIESTLYLTHIVDLDGFNLSVHQSLAIPEMSLIHSIYDNDRDPDDRCGGYYVGNQYAEIDETFNDSVRLHGNLYEK